MKHIKLSDINKTNPFRLPENYFRELPDRIMETCKKETRKQSFISVLKPALSLAALFIGVALIAYFAVNIVKHNRQNQTYTQKDIAEAEYTKQFSSQEELIEALKDSQKKFKEKEADQYIDYLLEEDIDYGTLIRELEEQKENDKNQ
jgi:hypothetical protein